MGESHFPPFPYMPRGSGNLPCAAQHASCACLISGQLPSSGGREMPHSQAGNSQACF